MGVWHACIALKEDMALVHAGSWLQLKEAELCQIVPSVGSRRCAAGQLP